MGWDKNFPSDLLPIQLSILAEAGEGIDEPLPHHGITAHLSQLGKAVGKGLAVTADEHDAHIRSLTCNHYLGVILEKVDLLEKVEMLKIGYE